MAFQTSQPLQQQFQFLHHPPHHLRALESMRVENADVQRAVPDRGFDVDARLLGWGEGLAVLGFGFLCEGGGGGVYLKGGGRWGKDEKWKRDEDRER